MRTYHVGILGSGVISRTYLADIQKFYHELQVTACADLDRARAQALALPLCGGYAFLGAVLLFQHYFVGPVYVVYR